MSLVGPHFSVNFPSSYFCGSRTTVSIQVNAVMNWGEPVSAVRSAECTTLNKRFPTDYKYPQALR
jgi:hypothetical protein